MSWEFVRNTIILAEALHHMLNDKYIGTYGEASATQVSTEEYSSKLFSFYYQNHAKKFQRAGSIWTKYSGNKNLDFTNSHDCYSTRNTFGLDHPTLGWSYHIWSSKLPTNRKVIKSHVINQIKSQVLQTSFSASVPLTQSHPVLRSAP